tara:strand:- start:318 stop:560 length:243 start_codon:yes stop_codon:yes gene_type:complete
MDELALLINFNDNHNMNNEQVYVVMAVEVQQTEAAEKFGCYCVCDSRQTAEQIIKTDTERGDIRPGAWHTTHVIQTEELI